MAGRCRGSSDDRDNRVIAHAQRSETRYGPRPTPAPLCRCGGCQLENDPPFVSALGRCARAHRRLFGQHLSSRFNGSGTPGLRVTFQRIYGPSSIQDASMNFHLTIGPLVSLIAGILILMVPRLLNYIVAIYLIIMGLLGLFGSGAFHLR